MNSTCHSPACVTASATESVTTVKPRYSVGGSEQSYVVQVQLPGVPKDAVNVSFEKGILSVQATRKTSVPETWKPLHRELNDNGYSLRLKLNAPVDEDKFTAQLVDGVLTLTLPIREAAKPRRIEVA